MKKLICLDAGHGCDTAGKRSPDLRVLEWKYCREIVKMLKPRIESLGLSVYIVTPEDEDVPLNTRVRRVNAAVRASKTGGLCLSIHNNAAASDGKWHNATGWECIVGMNASANSKNLARCLYESAAQWDIKVRRESSVIPYKTKNLAICRDTCCPAVLVENWFMDTKSDVDFLVSEKGKETVCGIIINGLKKYLQL